MQLADPLLPGAAVHVQIEGQWPADDLADPIQPALSSKKTSEELETGVGGERLLRELDLEIALDTAPDRVFP